MVNRVSESRWTWLAVGLAAGLCVSYFWPHEPVAASGNDRDAKFGILTTPMARNVEGVFVLDYLTGQLSGAVLNPATGTFNHTYSRKIADDFQVDAKAKPSYVFVAGQAVLPRNQLARFPGASVIYIGDKASGRVIAYKVNFPQTRAAVKLAGIIPIATYQFGVARLR